MAVISFHKKLQLRMRLLFRGVSFAILAFAYVGYNLVYNSGRDDEHRRLGDGCIPPANPAGLVILYVLGVLYLFVGLTIVADDFFVPALEVVADWWQLSPDVAGATLMAAGGSSPELFTNLAGTFLRSDVGFGAIVGSAVFNVLFVVGVCTLTVSKPMELDWYPISRDSLFYAFVLIVLAIFFGVITPNIIEWWEALIIHSLYWMYILIMRNNEDIRVWANGLVNKFSTINSESLIRPSQGGVQIEELYPSEPMKMTKANSTGNNAISFMKLMTSHVNLLDIASMQLELHIADNVNHAFVKYDVDRNGHIDSAELKSLCIDLGCTDISDHEVADIMKKVDTDGNGVIDLEEFCDWFLGSEQRLRADVVHGFHQYDLNHDGCLTKNEVELLLQNLSNNRISNEDLEAAINSLCAEDSNKITKEMFMNWYEGSALWKKNINIGESLAEDAEGLSLYPPEDATAFGWVWYVCTLPLVAAFLLTLPDVRKPGYQKYAYFSFAICLAWMGFFSYFMVSWTETIGATAKIPSVIMGLTFLAAGTSVPDMLSAVIVAKQGQGDQAVSSSIGSNVFDICIGLAGPWLLFAAVFQESVHVTAGNLFISILVLVLTLCLLVGLVKFRGWSLPRSSGYWLIFFYFCFVAQQLALTKWGQC